MCRSATVFEYKYEAKQAAKGRVLRGNQHLSSGKLRSRMYKKTGQLESIGNKIVDVCGYHYTAIVIKRTMERSQMLESSPKQADKRKQIRTQLTLRSD